MEGAEVLRTLTLVLYAILGLHMAILTVYLAEIGPEGGGVGTGVYAPDLVEDWNGTAIGEDWDYGSTNYLYDIKYGLKIFLATIRIMLVGFPDLMSALGTPEAISWPLYIFVAFVYVRNVIWFITGRDDE